MVIFFTEIKLCWYLFEWTITGDISEKSLWFKDIIKRVVVESTFLASLPNYVHFVKS